MVGGIKLQGHQPWRKEQIAAELFLDLPTMLTPSGEERTPRASAHRSSAYLESSGKLQIDEYSYM